MRVLDILAYALLFLFYLVEYTIMIFGNSALVGAALIRIKGGDPTLRNGFGIAFSHLGSMGYAFMAATVGLVLRWLSERGSLGGLASALAGMAWSLATFLVVPVLVTENLGRMGAVRRSADLLKNTWGEQILGNFSIGAIFGLTALAVVAGGGLVLFMTSGIRFNGPVHGRSDGRDTIPDSHWPPQLNHGRHLRSRSIQLTNTGKTGEFFSEELVRDAFRPRVRKGVI